MRFIQIRQTLQNVLLLYMFIGNITGHTNSTGHEILTLSIEYNDIFDDIRHWNTIIEDNLNIFNGGQHFVKSDKVRKIGVFTISLVQRYITKSITPDMRNHPVKRKIGKISLL